MYRYCVTVPMHVPVISAGSFAVHAFPLLNDSAIRKSFQNRDVKMNGVRITRDTRVLPGSEFCIYTSYDSRLPVVFENEHILVINKPAGLSCDRDQYGSMTVLDYAALLYPNDTLRAVHRLDNPTSGLLVLARTEPAEVALKAMFAAHAGIKEYHCLVKGHPHDGLHEAWLRKDPIRSCVTVSASPRQDFQQILTEIHTLHAGSVSLVQVLLHTGRTHQIRAHLAHLGHPLLGDDLYGDRDFNRTHRSSRLSLCCVRLQLQTGGMLSALDGLEFSISSPFDNESHSSWRNP